MPQTWREGAAASQNLYSETMKLELKLSRQPRTITQVIFWSSFKVGLLCNVFTFKVRMKLTESLQFKTNAS